MFFFLKLKSFVKTMLQSMQNALNITSKGSSTAVLDGLHQEQM